MLRRGGRLGFLRRFLLLLLGFAGGVFLFDADDRAVNGAHLHFGDVFLPGGFDIEGIDQLAVFLLEFFFLDFFMRCSFILQKILWRKRINVTASLSG